jgi:hypothetical protein
VQPRASRVTVQLPAPSGASGDATARPAADVDLSHTNTLLIYRSRGVGTRTRVASRVPGAWLRASTAAACADEPQPTLTTDAFAVTFFLHGADDVFS